MQLRAAVVDGGGVQLLRERVGVAILWQVHARLDVVVFIVRTLTVDGRRKLVIVVVIVLKTTIAR